jgi:hypothetical protein
VLLPLARVGCPPVGILLLVAHNVSHIGTSDRLLNLRDILHLDAVTPPPPTQADKGYTVAGHPRYPHLVVDVGANDGFLSSNSFNLVAVGWSAVLIEPDVRQLSLGQRTHARYIDPYVVATLSTRCIRP